MDKKNEKKGKIFLYFYKYNFSFLSNFKVIGLMKI